MLPGKMARQYSSPTGSTRENRLRSTWMRWSRRSAYSFLDEDEPLAERCPHLAGGGQTAINQTESSTEVTAVVLGSGEIESVPKQTVRFISMNWRQTLLHQRRMVVFIPLVRVRRSRFAGYNGRIQKAIPMLGGMTHQMSPVQRGCVFPDSVDQPRPKLSTHPRASTGSGRPFGIIACCIAKPFRPSSMPPLDQNRARTVCRRCARRHPDLEEARADAVSGGHPCDLIPVVQKNERWRARNYYLMAEWLQLS